MRVLVGSPGLEGQQLPHALSALEDQDAHAQEEDDRELDLLHPGQLEAQSVSRVGVQGGPGGG